MMHCIHGVERGWGRIGVYRTYVFVLGTGLGFCVQLDSAGCHTRHVFTSVTTIYTLRTLRCAPGILREPALDAGTHMYTFVMRRSCGAIHTYVSGIPIGT